MSSTVRSICNVGGAVFIATVYMALLARRRRIGGEGPFQKSTPGSSLCGQPSRKALCTTTGRILSIRRLGCGYKGESFLIWDLG